MNSFIGTYECKADAKGRVMVPAMLKKQLASVLQNGFVLKRSAFQTCLELYPMEAWNVLMANLNKRNRFKKKNNDFIRGFTAGVKIVEVDNAGRLLIPRDLMTFSGIKKEVVLASVVDIIEIWDKDSYEKVIDDTTTDFANLTEDVMGQDDDYGIS